MQNSSSKIIKRLVLLTINLDLFGLTSEMILFLFSATKVNSS